MSDDVGVESFRSGDMIVGRLLPGTELVPGLVQACKRHGARYAAVVSLIGSLRGTDYFFIEPDETSPFGIRYGRPVNVPGGVEIVGCQGLIGEWDDGRPSAHLHYTLIDTAGRMYSGHVAETGNPCLVTVEFALRILEGGAVIRRFDPGLGFPIFTFGKPGEPE